MDDWGMKILDIEVFKTLSDLTLNVPIADKVKKSS